jgi:hypothetical protein
MKTFKYIAENDLNEAMKLPDIISKLNKIHKQIGELANQLDKDLYDSSKVSNSVNPILNGIKDLIEKLSKGKLNS